MKKKTPTWVVVLFLIFFYLPVVGSIYLILGGLSAFIAMVGLFFVFYWFLGLIGYEF
ncbi:hypothetical protein MCEMIH22_00279 [Candidatus Methylacidiphilaceae bacterium]